MTIHLEQKLEVGFFKAYIKGKKVVGRGAQNKEKGQFHFSNDNLKYKLNRNLVAITDGSYGLSCSK